MFEKLIYSNKSFFLLLHGVLGLKYVHFFIKKLQSQRLRVFAKFSKMQK